LSVFSGAYLELLKNGSITFALRPLATMVFGGFVVTALCWLAGPYFLLKGNSKPRQIAGMALWFVLCVFVQSVVYWSAVCCSE
jgi:hypothetical protein